MALKQNARNRLPIPGSFTHPVAHRPKQRMRESNMKHLSNVSESICIDFAYPNIDSAARRADKRWTSDGRLRQNDLALHRESRIQPIRRLSDLYL